MKATKWTSDLPRGPGVYWWREEKGQLCHLLSLVEFGDTKRLHAIDVLGYLPKIRGPRWVTELGGEWLPINGPGKANEP